MEDDDATQMDMPALGSSYEPAGATLQDHPAPFAGPGAPESPARQVPSVKATTPGMPAAVRFDAEITTKSPAPQESGILTPPPVLAPELESHDGGATLPDGVPIPSWDPNTEPGHAPPSVDFDDAVTQREEVPPRRRRQGEVPQPGDPLVQVSPSMVLEVAQLEEKGRRDARRGRPAIEHPTEVLPALKKADPGEEKESSDAPLLILLAIVLVVIAVLAGAVVWGLVRTF